jgi:tripartite-type tricarboxylate transporter receptor subunit TctC
MRKPPLPRMLTVCLPLLVASNVEAQQPENATPYPTKPIRMLTSEPGGGGDVALRLIMPDLNAGLGQPIVIDNRPLSMSGEIVARAQPDGYTATVYGTTLWLGPLMQPMHYDANKDFAPVTIMTRSPAVLVVHPSVAVNSAKDLIALAKAKPGVLNYASGNNGSTSHLAMELFKSMAGINIVRIPYKGAGPATNALVAGEVQVMVATAQSAAPHIKSGRMKALGVTSAKPSSLIPDLPTVAATGLPGYEAASIYGMVTTARTPTSVIQRLNREVVKVLHKPDIKEKFLASGVEAVGSPPEELGAVIKSETARMGKVIKDAGIRAE